MGFMIKKVREMIQILERDGWSFILRSVVIGNINI